jgi:hypothetical protein
MRWLFRERPDASCSDDVRDHLGLRVRLRHSAQQALRGTRTKVLAVYGGHGHPAPFPIKVFEAEQPRLTALTNAFDAQADAIPVTTADQQSVDAFEAFRRESDKATAMLAAAATGKQPWFDAAYYEVHKMFDTSSALNDLHAAGIVCNAR